MTNDQVAYGRLGAAWLFKKLGGKGNVVEMRGIASVPADTDRHKGFQQALKQYRGSRSSSRRSPRAGRLLQAESEVLDILNSGVQVDGVWTSGIDYTVVNAFKTAGKPYVPVVGADNNEFLKQLINLNPKFQGSAVTNRPIGGVEAAVAIKVLGGGTVQKWTKLTPEVWDMANDAKTIKSYYSPKRPPTYSSQLFIKPWTAVRRPSSWAARGRSPRGEEGGSAAQRSLLTHAWAS